MIGLLYLKEDHVETIKEALVRYLQYNKALESLVKSSTLRQHSSAVMQDADQKKFYELVDMDHLINIFDFDIINVNFEKDIKRYEKKNPVRRHSFSDFEIAQYEQSYEELEINYIPDQNEFNLRQNDAEVQRADMIKHKKAVSMLDQEELAELFKELLKQ